MRSAVIGGTAALLATVVLTGCTSGRPPGVGAGPSADAADRFSGPWADEFAESFEDASAYERAVLEDGVVTAGELADAQRRKRECLRGGGYRWTIDEDGTSELVPLRGRAAPASPSAPVPPVWAACSRRYDRSITFLHDVVRRNPEKRGEAEITVACLRKAGLVGKDYSERQWRKEDETGEYSFPGLDPRAQQCRLDPLGLWRDG